MLLPAHNKYHMPLIQKLKDPLTAGIGVLSATYLISLAKILHDRKKRHGSWKETLLGYTDKEDVLPTAIASAATLGTGALGYLKDKRDHIGTKNERIALGLLGAIPGTVLGIQALKANLAKNE